MDQLFLTSYGPVHTSFFHRVTSYSFAFFHLNQRPVGMKWDYETETVNGEVNAKQNSH